MKGMETEQNLEPMERNQRDVQMQLKSTVRCKIRNAELN